MKPGSKGVKLSTQLKEGGTKVLRVLNFLKGFREGFQFPFFFLRVGRKSQEGGPNSVEMQMVKMIRFSEVVVGV